MLQFSVYPHHFKESNTRTYRLLVAEIYVYKLQLGGAMRITSILRSRAAGFCFTGELMLRSWPLDESKGRDMVDSGHVALDSCSNRLVGEPQSISIILVA
jgi:hypothetical protein